MGVKGTRNFRLLVSAEVFAIFADAVDTHNRNSEKFHGLRAVVEHACSRLRHAEFDAEDIDHFIRSTPFKGGVRVFLEMSPAWAPDFEALQARMEKSWGHPVKVRTAIAYLVSLAHRQNLY